jgi:hypothetical protein
MTPFTSKEHILLIANQFEQLFVALNVLSAEVQNHFEAQRQQSSDHRSEASNYNPHQTMTPFTSKEHILFISKPI